MMRKGLLLLVLVFSVCATVRANAYTAEELFYKMRSKLELVKDYVADVKMNIDVSYMKVPQLAGKVYFKAPDKMKLERKGGISILPKKGINLTLNSILPDGNDIVVIDGGYEDLNGNKYRIIKVIPNNDPNGVVLTKLWVDETRLLTVHTETTTRDNGTIEMDLTFGKYAAQSLPDKVVFYIDVKDYKIPQGLTMDYNTEETSVPKQQGKGKRTKGKIEIKYVSYIINQGISDNIFADKGK